MSVLSLPSAPANAHNGDMYYNTVEQEYYNFVDGEWVKQVNEDNATTIVQEVVVDEGYLKNTATGNNSLTIGGTASSNVENVNIGIGSNAGSGQNNTVIGKSASSSANGAVAVGRNSKANGNTAVALGAVAEANAQGAIMLGGGKNTEAQTFKVALRSSATQATSESNGLFTVLESDGTIPAGRYKTMVGADGTTAGTKGAVPAPTATDNTKFLRGDGTWASVDALPSQSGQSGKFLTTDGSDASWSEIDNSFIENQNENSSLKEIKVWEGSLSEFNTQTKPIYAWKGTTPSTNIITQTFQDAQRMDRGLIAWIAEEDRYLMVSDMGRGIYEFDKTLVFKKTYNCSGASPYITSFFKSGDYYVAAGYSNIFYSTDLVNWTSATASELPRPRTMTNIGTTWIIADENDTGNMYYSTDNGSTWTTVEGATGASSYVSEFDKVNGHVFTYSANGKNTFVSSDGITWTDTGYVRIRPSCYVNNTYYAITTNRDVYTSTDGITWTDTGKDLPSGYTGACLKYISDKFYIINNSSIASSTDLVNWTTYSTGGKWDKLLWQSDIPGFISLKYNTNTSDSSNPLLKWFLFDLSDRVFTQESSPSVGDTVYNISNTSLNKTISEIDGDTITLSDSSEYERYSISDWVAIISMDQKHPEMLSIIKDVGVRQYGDYLQKDSIRINDNQLTTLLSSGKFNGFDVDSGSTFIRNNGKLYTYFKSKEVTPIPVDYAYTNTWKWIEYGNGIFLGVKRYRETQTSNSSKDTTDIYISLDGLSWEKQYSFGTTNGDCTGLLFDGTKFIILFVGWNSNGKVFTSTDGVNWLYKSTIPDAQGSYIGYQHPLSYNGTRYVLSGRYSQTWKYSTDLVNWYSYTLPSGLNGYYYLNNYYNGTNFLCCVSDSSTVAAYSSNGTSWTQYTLPFKCAGFCECNGKFFAKASDGNNNVWVSTDGINWTETNGKFYVYYSHSVIYYDNKYHACDTSYKTLLSSSDGITWTEEITNINPKGYYNCLADMYKSGDFIFNKTTYYLNISSNSKFISLLDKNISLYMSSKIHPERLGTVPSSAGTYIPVLTIDSNGLYSINWVSYT